VARKQTVICRTLLFAVLASVSIALARAEAPADALTAQRLIAECKNWHVSAGKQLGRPTEDICREVAATGLAGRDACRAVAAKLAGDAVGLVSCTTWFRPDGDRLTDVPDVPDDIWNASRGWDHNRLREVLERRLGKDWEQAQVQKELEGVGFACGMSRDSPSLHVLGELSVPAFMCIARLSSISASSAMRTRWDSHLYIWVEVRFIDHAEPRRWRAIIVHFDGYTLF
jgi:hypothetical protein